MSRYDPTLEEFEAIQEVPAWFRSSLSRIHMGELWLNRAWWKGQDKPHFLKAVRWFAALKEEEIPVWSPREGGSLSWNQLPTTWNELLVKSYWEGKAKQQPAGVPR